MASGEDIVTIESEKASFDLGLAGGGNLLDRHHLYHRQAPLNDIKQRDTLD